MELKDLLNRITPDRSDMVIKIAKVTSVDESKRTINCEPIDNSADLNDVRLQASESKTVGFCIIPEVGSYVAVGTFLSDAAVVLLTDKVKSIISKVGDKTIEIDEKGIKISSQTANLKEEINTLVNEFDSLLDVLMNPSSFATGAGVPVVMLPGAITQLTQKKIALTTLKSKINSILQ